MGWPQPSSSCPRRLHAPRPRAARRLLFAARPRAVLCVALDRPSSTCRMTDVFDADELLECAALDCADREVIAERMHRSGYCATCCPYHTIDCPDCVDAESVDFDDDD